MFPAVANLLQLQEMVLSVNYASQSKRLNFSFGWVSIPVPKVVLRCAGQPGLCFLRVSLEP